MGWKQELGEKGLILLTFAVASGSSLDTAVYCLHTLSSLESFVPPGRRSHSVIMPEDCLNVGIALAACVLSDRLSKRKALAFEKHVCSRMYENWNEMKYAVAWAIADDSFRVAIKAIEMGNPELNEEEIGKLIGE